MKELLKQVGLSQIYYIYYTQVEACFYSVATLHTYGASMYLVYVLTHFLVTNFFHFEASECPTFMLQYNGDH